jgi:HupE / UreJ protein
MTNEITIAPSPDFRLGDPRSPSLLRGREPLIAAAFGLVHGLAFATVLAEFGLGPWRMAFCILGFNLGIELMQLAVVAATVPWLLLLSRTPVYTPLRIAGACFGAAAAIGWMAERALNWPNPVGSMVDTVAHRAVLVAAMLACMSLLVTAWQRARRMSATRPAPCPSGLRSVSNAIPGRKAPFNGRSAASAACAPATRTTWSETGSAAGLTLAGRGADQKRHDG